MRTTPNPHEPTSWEGKELIARDEAPPWRFFQWWYSWSSLPEPPASSSFVKRENARRSRLVSNICFLFIIGLILLIPGSLLSPNKLTIPLILFLFVICGLCSWFNRRGMIFLAGALLVIADELVLTAVLLTYNPLYSVAVCVYSLYVIVLLLAVSLLPSGYVFVFAGINSLLIWYSLTFQLKTVEMAGELSTQYTGVLFVNVVLQIVVAGIAFLWVSNTNKALRRADRAEMVAALEHRLVQQRETALQEKQQLEASIQQLVEVYIETTKKQQLTRIPYPPAKVLWPLVGVMNALAVRLQHSNQVEQELQRLQHAINAYTLLLQPPEKFINQHLPSQRTKTALDPLISAMSQIYYTVSRFRRDV